MLCKAGVGGSLIRTYAAKKAVQLRDMLSIVQKSTANETHYTVQITLHVGAEQTKLPTTSFPDLIICGTYNKLTPTSWPTLYVWAPAHFKLRAVKFPSLKCGASRESFWWSFLYYANKEPSSFVLCLAHRLQIRLFGWLGRVLKLKGCYASVSV